MRLLPISATAFGLALLVAAAPASAIDITSLSNGTAADTWLDGTAANQTRNGGTTTLSGLQSPDGDGSLRLHSPDANGKATAIYTGGGGGLGMLEFLNGISYQYYRDPSSTNPDAQAPSLRLHISDGQGRDALLVYEPVYNNVNPIPEGSWQTVDALAGNWWLFEGGAFENFGLTLADWLTDNVFENATQTDTAQGFGINAVILGIEVGIGSGWAGESLAYVDNIILSFLTDDQFAYGFDWNFQAQQTEVPEPTSMMLLGSGLAGLYLVRRRRRAS